MKPTRLPSLAALRALEAVSRHGSFAAAARELNVTQSAVSYQIRTFEDLWQTTFFIRNSEGVELTSDGRLVRDLAQRIVGDIGAAYQSLAPARAVERFSVLVPQSIAARWLVPRLIRFSALDETVELSLFTEAGAEPASAFDVAVGFEPAPEAIGEPALIEDVCIPVASPAFLDRLGTDLRTPSDLIGHPLLQRTVPNKGAMGWDAWFEAVGVVPAPTDSGLGKRFVFGNSNLVLAAAEAGMGIALARGILALDALKRGTLRLVGGTHVPFANPLFVRRRPPAMQSVAIDAFCHWLRFEADQTAAELRSTLAARSRSL